MAKRQVIFLTLLTVLSVFCLAVAWEFWIEPLFEPGYAEETSGAKWEFVVTSVTFAAIALIIPSLISIRNIVDRARADAGLVHAKEAAESASWAKSRFLATMSHELRTPLNAIIGFSEIMATELHGPLENDKYRDYAEDIHNSAGHLLDLINDILELSKAEAGRLELDEGIMDLWSLVDSSARLMRQSAACGDVVLKTEMEGAPRRLRGDQRKVKQVLLNLLSNAVKFTPPGGRIVVRAERDRAGALRLTVRDNGVGIAEEELALVLEPFGQARNQVAPATEGTGLGLPIAKAMVELHGGSLTLDSAVGVGTTVTVLFPAERVPDEARSAA